MGCGIQSVSILLRTFASTSLVLLDSSVLFKSCSFSYLFCGRGIYTYTHEDQRAATGVNSFLLCIFQESKQGPRTLWQASPPVEPSQQF